MDSICVAYANALISLIEEENKDIKLIVSDLKQMDSTFDNDVRKFLFSKSIANDEKKQVLDETLKGIDKDLLSFLKVLVDNNRIDKLSDIIKECENIVNDKQGYVSVNLRTYKKLSSDYLEDLKIIIKKRFSINKNIIINEIIDETLLDGVVIDYQGQIIDLSLDSKKKNMKEYLEK